MLESILTFQFILNQKPSGEVEPEFQPIILLFNNDQFSDTNYSDLISKSDIFSIFYHHTTGIHEIRGSFSNFYMGRLKEHPYQVYSYFKQVENETQFVTILIFSLTDDIEIFEEIIKKMAARLDYLYESLEKARTVNQVSLISNINNALEKELKFVNFQIERLFNLDKIQKAALIFNNPERLTILNNLREAPKSKKEMREILEQIKENPNLDLLLEPFLELNLIKRDWIKGERDKKTGIIKDQGECLFLTKDIILVRVPNSNLINYLKENESELYPKYMEKVIEFFSPYDPTNQPAEETKKLASILLNPDLYDNLVLMRNKFYPSDKIPNIFSEFVNVSEILDDLKDFNIITEITDKTGRNWIFLLTDIKPIIFFPEFLLLKIRDAYKTSEHKFKISNEMAKKALELLETAYPEKIEF